MKYKSIIAVVIFILLTTIFAMSDDGVNEPQIEKSKEVKHEVTTNVDSYPLEQTVQVKSSKTVKDQLGIDTGMTKVELEIFKTQYMKKAEKLGILEHKSVSPKSYFDHNINLNAVDELKKLGLFLTHTATSSEESFAYNIIHSDIIAIGSIDKVQYLCKDKEEERNAYGNIRSRFFVKINRILKGSENLVSSLDEIPFISSKGKFIISSGSEYVEKGKEYIFFFQKGLFGKEEFKNDYSKLKGSLMINNERVFFEYFDTEFKSYEEILSIIENFNKINDSENFYQRNYIIKEAKNDK
ncbi:MAG: hypothetical protein PF638_13205 [Candidatus Delongbacteria bacterium]|nr:hypothetical protein [Candidatus Delongbacteria bacterium]